MRETGGRVRKTRTSMSCSRCKARKTKCNNPVPGPCDYCSSIDEVCQIDTAKRKQKPYYFVSEEEYRHMQRILKHQFPDKDLNLSTLRSIALQCEQRHDSNFDLPVATVTTNTHRGGSSVTTEHTATIDASRLRSEDDVDLQEIVDLNKGLGCILVDGRGEYRYTGVDSGVGFNTAVRTWKTKSPHDTRSTEVITPMSTVMLPATTSQITTDTRTKPSPRLPSRDLCLIYVTRFFEEVHCLYWLYSSEQFHTRLEATYARDTVQAPSWLCSLYCVFALGSLATPSREEEIMGSYGTDYLDFAKALVPGVCDEANLDSVRALILLALALLSHGFSNSAYVYAATAVRIAFSLGLHVDKYSIGHGRVEKEHGRRIWWVLYIFDQEIAHRTGKPCMIEASSEVLWRPPLPSEQIVNPGSHTPSGYLKVSIALSRLTKTCRDSLYIGPLTGGHKLSLSTVETLLSSLRDWQNNVPPYLSHSAVTAPQHRRCVALLHVRYWSIVILISRPFMLHTLLTCRNGNRPSSSDYFQGMGNVCLEAAQQSLDILQQMLANGAMSSIEVSDFYYALELVQIFLLALAIDPSEVHVENIRRGLGVLQGMESFGVCHRMLPEVLNQLKDWGILQGEMEDLASMQDFDTSFLRSDAGYNFHEMLINSNDSGDLDPTDAFFAGMDIFDGGFTDGIVY